jgi:Nuclear pore complex scaffold, nucleoporins 186/192/205
VNQMSVNQIIVTFCLFARQHEESYNLTTRDSMEFSFNSTNPTFAFGSDAASNVATNNELPWEGLSTAESTNMTAALVNAIPANRNMQVPKFVDIFPYQNLLNKVRYLYSKMTTSDREAKFAVQKLLQITGSTVYLSNPPPPVFVAPEISIRQQLQVNSHVILSQSLVSLTPQMLLEVFAISDALHISEQSAISIYAHVSQPEVRQYLENCEKDSKLLHDIPAAACALFFRQRLALWKIILILTQSRLENKNVEASDVLMNNNLILNIVHTFRLINQLVEQEQSRINQFTLCTTSGAHSYRRNKHQWLNHLHQEQNLASQCLFYLAYSTQLKSDEVASILDLIRDITNYALPILDPTRDVPDPCHFHHTVATPQWSPFTPPPSPPTEKTIWEWEDELVQMTWSKSEAPVLQFTSILVMSVISAIDTQQCLLDRQTHNLHSFGVVRKYTVNIKFLNISFPSDVHDAYTFVRATVYFGPSK